MPGPLRLFFLWHFHQPWYLELGNPVAPLPWVRLHALKDYVDLADVLSEEPRVPHVANLVPGLLDQIELIASGAASDTWLEIAKTPVGAWDSATVDFVLDNFFSVHPRRLGAFPRFLELSQRRQALHGRDRAAAFSEQDLRDLVVLFHLAWSGEALSKDPLLARLKRQRRRFSEDDRSALLERQRAYVGDVIPAWKRAFASGVVEAATSAYHHPILPLLVDTGSGREALPTLPLPPVPFRRPEDAEAQLALGLETFARHFGFTPGGMWPPEGALSAGALRVMGRAGVVWTASDEEILLHSIGAAAQLFGPGDRARAIFHPHRQAGGPVIFFRDRILSDRIGFSYATWNEKDAAQDFVKRLLAIREAAPEADLLVPVILDGENAWEAYPENGLPFLRALAAALVNEPSVEVTTPARVLGTRESAPLPRVVAGSWVNGTLTTWIGAPAKNRAWTLLGRAREELASEIASAPLTAPGAFLGAADGPAAARAALLAAEASDWFWWFGEDHSSAQDPVFDALFRSHLGAAYRALGRDVPTDLRTPVDVHGGAPKVLPTTPIAPAIDGRSPDYFEWLGAGRVYPGTHGTMNRGEGLFAEVYLGGSADGTSLFFRLDAARPPASRLSGIRLRLALADEDGQDELVAYDFPLVEGLVDAEDARIATGRIVEIRVPRPPELPDTVAFRIVALDAEGNALESLPHESWTRFRVVMSDWSA